MKRKLSWALGALAFLTLGNAAGCSDSKGNTCDTSGQQASTLEVGCHGSAKSCFSIGISTESGRRACAYQEGCELSYEYMECRGSVVRCSDLDEFDCDDQIGCKWEDGSGSSSGGSAGNVGTSPGQPGADPCASSGSGGQAGSGTSPGNGGTAGAMNPGAGGSGLPGSGGTAGSMDPGAGGSGLPGSGGSGTPGSGGSATPPSP